MEMIRTVAMENRRRLVGAVMDHFDKRVMTALPVNVRQQVKDEFREKLYQAAGQYHDFVLDVIKASLSESTVNEVAIEMLREIHARIVSLPIGD